MNFEILNAFRFDGVAALLANEIDVLVTPDPIAHPELIFQPVFDYELVLVVDETNRLADLESHVTPQDLRDQVLFTVPVDAVRLDIFAQFLVPAGCRPRRWQGVESIDLTLQMVAAGRGITVLPKWLVRESGATLPLRMLRIGETGLQKSINLGTRKNEERLDYIQAFIEAARGVEQTS